MTKKQKKELKKILIAGVLFAILMVLEHTHVLPQVFENRWLCLLVYLVPYCICGLSVLKKAVSGVRHKQMLDESFLMALASVGAFATGEAGEAAAVMLFYQVGEFFQSYAVGKSRRSISDLMDIAPEFANVEREDGSIETIDPDEVEIDDILIIKPGEKIPVDGSVTEGESMVNTAALTGESVPRSVGPGSQIISGCINGNGLLKVRAEKIYEDSTVAKILELVESASEKKSRTENFITRFARWYTPLVVAGAVLLALIPPLFLGDFGTWIYRACTFLVISCPCALVISVPLAFFGGIGAASSKGVLVKGSNYLELLANLDTIVSDKTGTLTKGDFRVTKVLPAGDTDSTALLAIAAAAESMSTHPIAVSIQNAWQEHLSQPLSNRQLPEDNTAVSGASAGLTYRLVSEENVTGKGISALLTGGKEDAQIQVLAGNASLLEDHSVSFTPVSDAASTVVYVARDGAYIGAVLIRDEAKAEAADAIRRMKQEGVREAVMLTGDRTAVGEAVAKELGIDRVFAELLPQDKVTKVEEIISGLSGRKMGFIGDGINDAPVLSRADVGIAMGSMGSDAAIEAADVVIMDDNLLRISDVMRVAKRTVGIARQNIVFALAVKIGILILGAFGIANMWAAVFADVGVAVICILNSMRLLAEKRTI